MNQKQTPNQTILVVDDEPALRELIQEVLKSVGFKVDTAEDGASALTKIRSSTYDLIVSDVKMPGMDGRELYDKVVTEQLALAKRFLITTGDTVAPDTRRFLEERGIAHIAKPFRLAELTMAVRKLLAQ